MHGSLQGTKQSPTWHPATDGWLPLKNGLAPKVLGEWQLVLGRTMLSHCANSNCCKPFLKLREGKLFLVETDRIGKIASPPFVRARQTQHVVEHYWLCDECAATWTLIFDRERGIALVPLRRAAASAMPMAASSGAA